MGRHSLTAYRKSLEEVIRTQLRLPKFENELQGVLELAESIDLFSTLLADLDDVRMPGHLAAAAAATAGSLLLPEEASKYDHNVVRLTWCVIAFRLMKPGIES